MKKITLMTRKKTGVTVLKVNGKRLCFLNVKDALFTANRISETYPTSLSNEELNSSNPYARRAIKLSKEPTKERGFSYVNV